MRTEQAVVGGLVRSLRPVRALDVGTGSGRYLPQMSAAGASVVVGLDFSRRMLGRAPRCGWRVCADGRRLPFAAGSFDMVNASLVAGDIQDLDEWLRELAAVLEPGGHVVYSDFHPSWTLFGWRRTFTAPDGRVLEIPFVAHSLERHAAAVHGAGLELLARHALPLAGDGADVRAFRRRFGALPVLVVVHARQSEGHR